MSKFVIPRETANTEPSELTQVEMADLTATTRRSTILYEKTIKILHKDINYLKMKLDDSDIERKEAVILMKRFVILHVNGAFKFCIFVNKSIFLGVLLDLNLD